MVRVVNDKNGVRRRLVTYLLSSPSYNNAPSSYSYSHSHTHTLTRRFLHRGFFSALCNFRCSPRKHNNFGIEKGSNVGGFRSIHVTGFMSAPATATATEAPAVRDYYDILGVSKDASSDDIKQAYYGLAKKLHPDINRDDICAEERFQEIQKSYEVLKDDEKRSLYDQVGHDAFEESGAEGMNAGMEDMIKDIFEREFGGKNVQVSLELSFMEAIQGCSKTLSFQTSIPCEACGGKGVPPGTRPETCKACRGSGLDEGLNRNRMNCIYNCIKCGGTGKTVTNYCKSCKGVRVVRGSKTVKIDVPPGIDNNETFKMFRTGGTDPEGNHRDLCVTIKVKEDPLFRREGANIHVDVVLSGTQATHGGTIQVPTLTGDVALKVQRGTQPGQKVVLKRKGIKTRKSPTFGDQYVHFTAPT